MSTLTRPDAIHVDVIGDKDGGNRVRTLGTASILGILPDGHMWTQASKGQEAQCCGTFHVDVEGQTTYIRCVTTGATILSSRGLVKTLQMMADMTNTPVIVAHDPGASSTIKDAEYTPSGEFAPVAEVDEFGHCLDGKCGACTDCADVAQVTEDRPGFDEAMAEAEAEDFTDVAEFVAQEWVEAGCPRDPQGRPAIEVEHAYGRSAMLCGAPIDQGRGTSRMEWVTCQPCKGALTVRTANGVEISDGLAVWDYDLALGRIDLGSLTSDGWFSVAIDGEDRRSLMNGERVTTVHPSTGESAEQSLTPVALDIPAPGEVEALMAEYDAPMAAWAKPLVKALADGEGLVGKRAWGPNGLQGTIEAAYSNGSVNLTAFGRSVIVAAGQWRLMTPILTDADIRAQVETALDGRAREYDCAGLVNALIEAHGRVGVDDIDPEAFWAMVADWAWDSMENEIWAGTDTNLIKLPIRTKLRKRARRMARKAGKAQVRA